MTNTAEAPSARMCVSSPSRRGSCLAGLVLAMLLTAGASIALGGLVAGLAGMRLSHSLDSFRRSRKQLWLNLAWVRTVLVTSAGAGLHPRRRL